MLLKSTFLFTLVSLVGLASRGLAHPGEAHDPRDALREAGFRHAVADINSKALSKCGNNAAAQARRERAMKRRLETFQRLRAERGVDKEDAFLHRRNSAQFAKWAGISHDRTGSLDFTTDTPHQDIFGANSTCILTPDNIIGPYYVLGEQIRSNIVESHPGVPVHLEMQFVDVQTCEPTPRLFIDLWQCNATGVYSGVSAAGQGGLRSTFLRGVQETDSDGVVEFDTIFPGHYQGRATHQHITVHVGAEKLPNNTYSGGTVSHISQLFFDQALIDAVENTAPYNTNRVRRTSNAADFYTGYSATAAYDPFPEYILLKAGDLSKGIFMWLEVAFNASANYDSYTTVAAVVGPNGGVNNPGFNMGKAITPPPTHG
ncbi:GPI anchored dioxygenase [Madurella fahalii]|uniref:GPI anchored dioxygenase n=1 Tax=Madurella fahalii TaxID=1157608 RepID=A0ABQ0G539_9PEZI